MGVNASALHRAAGAGDMERLAELVRSADVKLDAVDGERNTPLHAAALYGHVDCAVFLIAKGAKVNAINLDSSTPLHFAAGRGHLDVVRVLCDNGAELNRQNRRQYTPLLTAVFRNQEATAVELVHRGADVNITTKFGYTASHLAQRNKLRAVYDSIQKAAAAQPLLPTSQSGAQPTASLSAMTPSEVGSRGNVEVYAHDRDMDQDSTQGSPLAAEFSAPSGPYGDEEGDEGTALDRAAGATDATRCLSCYERPSTVVLLPCRHLCVCEACRSQFDERMKIRCPVCRTPVDAAQAVGK